MRHLPPAGMAGRTLVIQIPCHNEEETLPRVLADLPTSLPGIARIITPALPHPGEGTGLPRCELYLLLEALGPAIERAHLASATVVAAAKDHDWGHRVAYFADPDGHVLALAEPIAQG